MNPMAVELCKVNLWMEALEPGKPLAFLEHRIRCGNSLLGTTPALLTQGILDVAFTPIEGDDKAVVSAFRKRNKTEREGQMTFTAIAESIMPYGSLADTLVSLDAIDDTSIAGVHDKEARYARLASSLEYRQARLTADAWCAAFVWEKTKDAPEPVTHDVFCRLLTEPERVPAATRVEIVRLAEQYNFFHWHLAFPDIFRVHEDGEEPENGQTGWNGGFDVVLGNPPWDMQEVKDNEFFSTSFPEILAVRSAKDKAIILEKIKSTEPQLWHDYEMYVRLTYGQKHFMLESGRFPLSAIGRLNLYRLFLENSHTVISSNGRVGLIIPSGFASDTFSQKHFNELHGQGRLVSLYDFENREALFPGVDRRYKFCLVTVSGACQPDHLADFVFFARHVDELRDVDRHVPMSKHDLYALNPLSGTAPLFQSKRDMRITLHLHDVAPILAKEDGNNVWRVKPTLMFMMNASMTTHRSAEELETNGYQLYGNRYVKGEHEWLPLYEGKMVAMYDHRSASIKFDASNRVRRNQPDPLSETEHADPERLTLPMFWVDSSVVSNRCGSLPRWCLAIKDITSATNERTAIAAILPCAALTHSVPWLANSRSPALNACLLANLNAFALDFAARQKVAGLHLYGHYLTQLPILAPSIYTEHGAWDEGKQCLESWVLARVLELTYTAWDLRPFAIDCGYSGPPFRWDEERRFLLRCELDAAYFHLYGITRDDVDYIMETFPIVKRNDMKQYGDFRTKLMILDIYDRMQQAMDTGEPYQTLLDPPPADPRVAHPPRTEN